MARLRSLDVLRGITIAGMILVNNPGTWAHIYAPLRHAAWNGCTPTDLVFPFFMFVMGVAMFISYRKFDYTLTAKSAGHLVYRSLMLVLIGWAIGWFGIFCRTLSGGGEFVDAIWNNPVAHLRYMGVLPRLGWVSLFAGLLLMLFKPKRAPIVSLVLLVIYCVIIGVTGSFELTGDNIVARVDRAVLGEEHMYHLGGIAFDPEGILSTIPCIAHCLLGCWVGKLLFETDDLYGKVVRVLLFGAVSLMLGFLLDYAFPINKSLWSASYVLLTCGLASLLLGVLIWLIDIFGKTKWCVPFECFGVNPMFIFVLSGVLAIIMANIRFEVGGDMYSVWGFFYKRMMQPLFGDLGGSLACAVIYDALLWCIAYPLYKRKIYIKI
ncbi:MAG: DUF5009 domain-containing protein [Paludibacteraceae bacterium]|nr:DUF5009 domain-containing protein [Paludibacteraceae bacterium]